MGNEISIVLLTYNEQKHIKRCLDNLFFISDNIYIIDSYSTDNTVQIATEAGAKVFQNPWVNYAQQFQWALDNCGIATPWIMRMDADEYLEQALVKEIQEKLPQIIPSITGIYLKRKVIFKNKWIRHGGFYPHTLLRIWRNGTGSIEQRWMDEHIVLNRGETCIFKENLVDHNLNNINWWVSKHNAYAIREMVDLLNIKYKFLPSDARLLANEKSQAKWKRYLKENVYSSVSPGLRSTLYFLYRYFVRFGSLDGYKGFIFHFMQGYWYRMLVDTNILEVEEKIAPEADKQSAVVNVLRSEYNVKF